MHTNCLNWQKKDRENGTGEELEIIFEGEEEGASEIFGKYIVTSEGGDSMTYYKRGSKRNRDGFTLLELVAALSLSAVHRDLGSRLFRQSDA